VILGAALLVLIALGLFVGGIATGASAFYWACVAVSALAAVLLFTARRRMGRAPAGDEPGPAEQRPQRPAAGRAEEQAAVPPDAPPAQAVPSATAGTDGPEPLLSQAGEVANEAPAGAERAARDRPAEAGDGRVASLPHGEPAGTVSGATATGGAQDGAVGPPPEPMGAVDGSGDPPVEEVEVTDLLLVVDLRDEVLVVDEHPRYHVAGCPWLTGRTTIPLPLDEARTDGFTPCARCAPDRTLAGLERARRSEGPPT
jgi:hypothetical protein